MGIEDEAYPVGYTACEHFADDTTDQEAGVGKTLSAGVPAINTTECDWYDVRDADVGHGDGDTPGKGHQRDGRVFQHIQEAEETEEGHRVRRDATELHLADESFALGRD